MDVISYDFNGFDRMHHPSTIVIKEVPSTQQHGDQTQNPMECAMGLSNASCQNEQNLMKQYPDLMDPNNALSNEIPSTPPQNQQNIGRKRHAQSFCSENELERKQVKREEFTEINSIDHLWSQIEDFVVNNLIPYWDDSLLPEIDMTTVSCNMSSSQPVERNVNIAESAAITKSDVSPEADNNNVARNECAMGNLHQLLYAFLDDYPPTTSPANQVASSAGHFNNDYRFQYVLVAATSTATKVNEETLTYLNQGQSYEIKLKKLCDLSAYRGQNLKSTIRLSFRDKRLQYREREQIAVWQSARSGERILEVDEPLCYGIVDPFHSSVWNNTIEFFWDPAKKASVYIKINCVSTEFTPKKHGGEKGVPFRILVDTYLSSGPRVHNASCQVKVFKLKGANRKHKQDRDKIRRRPLHEQKEYQPSFVCTIFSDSSSDWVPSLECHNSDGNSSTSIESSPRDSVSSFASVDEIRKMPTGEHNDAIKEEKLIEDELLVAYPTCDQSVPTEVQPELSMLANMRQTQVWLRTTGFQNFITTFSNYNGADMLRLSREDTILLCGRFDGIRLYNALRARPPRPRLSVFIFVPGSDVTLRTLCVFSLTVRAFIMKLTPILGIPYDDRLLESTYMMEPGHLRTLVTDDVIAYMENFSIFFVQVNHNSMHQPTSLFMRRYIMQARPGMQD